MFKKINHWMLWLYVKYYFGMGGLVDKYKEMDKKYSLLHKDDKDVKK